MAVITKDLAITTKDDRGNQILYHPFTTVDNVENAVATVNGVKPDSSGDVKVSADIPTTVVKDVLVLPEIGRVTYKTNDNVQHYFKVSSFPSINSRMIRFGIIDGTFTGEIKGYGWLYCVFLGKVNDTITLHTSSGLNDSYHAIYSVNINNYEATNILVPLFDRVMGVSSFTVPPSDVDKVKIAMGCFLFADCATEGK